MMVCDALPTCDAGVVGAQNCFQLDSCIAIALSSSHGNFAATITVGVGLPQPWPMLPSDGPCVPHAAGPPETSAKMPCHCATVGFVPATASTAQCADMPSALLAV